MGTLKDKERVIWSYVWETLHKKNREDSNTEDAEVFLSKDVKKAISNFDDILYGYGDENLLKEYRKIFGNSYEKEENCKFCGLNMKKHDSPGFCPAGTEEFGGRR